MGWWRSLPRWAAGSPCYQLREVADFYAVFGAMEGAVAGVAAVRRTEEQLQLLQEVNDEIGELAGNPDPRPAPTDTGC